MKKKMKCILFSTALGLGLIGVSFINPVITEAGCQGYYADGKTGDIVPWK